MAELKTRSLPAVLREETIRLYEQVDHDDLLAEEEALIELAISDEMDEAP